MSGTPWRESRTFVLLVGVLVVLAAVPMLFVVSISGAPATLLLATVLAALPVPALVACYLWLDRYEPEPRSLLWLALGWGAFVATSAALVMQLLAGAVLGVSSIATVAGTAPITEEATKGVFLLTLLWWRRHELDGILDGLVYAGLVGIGFAFCENILYLAAAYDGANGMPGGGEVLTWTFVVRCVASPFAHSFFTTFVGLGVGVAVMSRSGLVRFAAPIAGYILAVVLHGVWNYSSLRGPESFALTYIVLMVPAFLLIVGLAVWARRSERTILQRALGDAVRRGLMPAADVPHVVSLTRRRQARAFARQHGGADAAEAMAEYQQAAAELGFLHHRYLRGTPPPDFERRGAALVTRMHAARPHTVFPAQGVAV